MIALTQDRLQLVNADHEAEVHATPNLLFFTLKLDKLWAPAGTHAPGQDFVLKVKSFNEVDKKQFSNYTSYTTLMTSYHNKQKN